MPTNWAGLAVLLLAVVPGFIATTTWSRARTWKGPSSDFRTTLQALALSAVVQVAMLPLTVRLVVPHRADLEDHVVAAGVWAALTVLILPVCLGLSGARLTDLAYPANEPMAASPRRLRRWLQTAMPRCAPPTTWDWLFTTRPPDGSWVLVQFKDGTTVGGVFTEGSLALTSPEPQGLFLAEEWVVDENGDFFAPVPDSSGVLIPSVDDVRWVRVLAPAITTSEKA